MTPFRLDQVETRVSHKNEDIDVKPMFLKHWLPEIVPRAWAALGEPMEAHEGPMGGHGQSIGSPLGAHWGPMGAPGAPMGSYWWPMGLHWAPMGRPLEAQGRPLDPRAGGHAGLSGPLWAHGGLTRPWGPIGGQNYIHQLPINRTAAVMLFPSRSQ